MSLYAQFDRIERGFVKKIYTAEVTVNLLRKNYSNSPLNAIGFNWGEEQAFYPCLRIFRNLVNTGQEDAVASFMFQECASNPTAIHRMFKTMKSDANAEIRNSPCMYLEVLEALVAKGKTDEVIAHLNKVDSENEAIGHKIARFGVRTANGVFCRLLRQIAETGKIDEVIELLSAKSTAGKTIGHILLRRNTDDTKNFYVNLLNYLRERGKSEEVIRLLTCNDDNGYNPGYYFAKFGKKSGSVDYFKLLESMLNDGFADGVVEVLKHKIGSGLQMGHIIAKYPDYSSVNSFFAFLKKLMVAGEVDEVVALLTSKTDNHWQVGHYLGKNGIPQVNEVYYAFLRHLVQNGKTAEVVGLLHSKTKKRSTFWSLMDSTLPESFFHLLNDLIETGQEDEVLALLRMKGLKGRTLGHFIAKRGTFSEVQHYTTLLNKLINKGKDQEVIELLDLKDENNDFSACLLVKLASSKSIFNYQEVLSHLVGKGYEDWVASHLLTAVQDDITLGYKISMAFGASYNEKFIMLLKALLDKGKVDEVCAIISKKPAEEDTLGKRIFTRGQHSVYDAYIEILQSLLHAGKVDEVRVLVFEHGRYFWPDLCLASEGNQPFYLSLAKALLHKGSVDDVLSLLDFHDGYTGMINLNIATKGSVEDKKDYIKLLVTLSELGQHDWVIKHLNIAHYNSYGLPTFTHLLEDNPDDDVRLEYIKLLEILLKAGKVEQVKDIVYSVHKGTSFRERVMACDSEVVVERYKQLKKIARANEIMDFLSNAGHLTEGMQEEPKCVETIYDWLVNDKLDLPEREKDKKKVFKKIQSIGDLLLEHIMQLKEDDKRQVVSGIMEDEKSQLSRVFSRSIRKKIKGMYTSFPQSEEELVRPDREESLIEEYEKELLSVFQRTFQRLSAAEFDENVEPIQKLLFLLNDSPNDLKLAMITHQVEGRTLLNYLLLPGSEDNFANQAMVAYMQNILTISQAFPDPKRFLEESFEESTWVHIDAMLKMSDEGRVLIERISFCEHPHEVMIEGEAGYDMQSPEREFNPADHPYLRLADQPADESPPLAQDASLVSSGLSMFAPSPALHVKEGQNLLIFDDDAPVVESVAADEDNGEPSVLRSSSELNEGAFPAVPRAALFSASSNASLSSKRVRQPNALYSR